ncbi:MAG: hypothetical protein ACOYXM_16850 [Actinomycetota bacterium]
MTAHTVDDLALLESVVLLTRTRVTVAASDAFERTHGRRPEPIDWVGLRLSVLRLERDGLLRSDRVLRLEATPDGEVAAELHRAGRSGTKREAS